MAATCASIINYKKATNLTASDVVTYVFGSPVERGGTVSNDISAYNHWGLHPYYDSSNETFSDAKIHLQASSPIHSLWYSTNNGHSMTVRGYEVYQDGYKDYLLIDPNIGYTSVTAQTFSGNIQYTMDGENFYWSESIKAFNS